MNTIINADMNQFWNGAGGDKWVHFQELLDTSLVSFGQQAMHTLEIETGEWLLDIGCGCGDTTFALARQVGSSGQVQGIDISNVILQQARYRAAKATQSNVQFICADAQSYQFAKKSLDVVFSRFGVMFFDDPVAAFSNIRQVLKPTGRIGFICWQPITANQWVSLPLEIAANHMALPEPISHNEPGAFSFGDKNRVSAILTAAGFIDISIIPFDNMFNIGMSTDEAVKFITHIGPLSSVLEDTSVNKTTLKCIFDELYHTLATHISADGIQLAAACWVVTAKRQ